MTSPPPMDPMLSSLLEAERAAPGPDEATQARVWQRLATSVGGGVEPSSSSHHDHATAERPYSRHFSAPQPPPPLPNLTAWMVGPMLFGVGVLSVLGQLSPTIPTSPAAGRAGLDQPQVVRPQVVQPQVVQSPTAPVATAPTTQEKDQGTRIVAPQPDTTVASAPSALVPHGPPTRIERAPRRRLRRQRPAPSPDPGPARVQASGGLRAELKLIRAARAALSARQPDRALVILKTYRERFRTGQLREEASALRVVGLAHGDDPGSAKAAGEAFLRRYPNSLQTGVVRAALARGDVGRELP